MMVSTIELGGVNFDVHWNYTPATTSWNSSNCNRRKEMHLRYSMYDAPSGHPQTVMRDLGINYENAIPQSIADQWWFINCSNVPEKLPPYLSEMKYRGGF